MSDGQQGAGDGGQQQGQQGQQQQQSQQGQQQQQTPWHGLTDEADVAYVSNKGWKGPQDLYKSYRSAETLIGRDPNSVVPIPKPGDQAGWDAVYAKLGRPESPDKYDLKAGLPADAQVDEAFTTGIANLFHKAGLTAEQAKAVAAGWNEMGSARQQQSEKDRQANLTADKQMLQREWGGGFERQMTNAKLAVQELGFTEAEVNALEDAIGYRGVMQKFAEIGKRLADPSFVGGGGQPKFDGLMTPAEAGEEIRKLKMDDGFAKSIQDKWHPAHKENKEKWNRLHGIAYPG